MNSWFFAKMEAGASEDDLQADVICKRLCLHVAL